MSSIRNIRQERLTTIRATKTRQDPSLQDWIIAEVCGDCPEYEQHARRNRLSCWRRWKSPPRIRRTIAVGR